MITGEPIAIVMRDLGEQPGEVYASCFETGDWVLLSQVSAARTHAAPDPAKYRQAQDFALLSAHGVDCDTLKIVERAG